MTTNTPAIDVQTSPAAAPRENYLNCSKGFKSWALTLDHKRIGLMYLVGVSIAFLAGGLFALLVRLHLWEPEGMLFTNIEYNQIFTLHGAFMVFLFVIPAVEQTDVNAILTRRRHTQTGHFVQLQSIEAPVTNHCVSQLHRSRVLSLLASCAHQGNIEVT